MSSLQLLSPEDARELFLWRWKDVTREDINEHLKEFKKFDLLKTGELEENHAMMLLESRGETKTARELRETFTKIDVNNNRKISFLEWCCYIYNKDFSETNSFVDVEARNAAMAEVQRAAEHARAVEEAAARAKAQEEEEARRRAEELERESQLTGVAGMSAFFKRQIEKSGDVTQTNEQRIKEEAARRKALREAKKKEQEALDAANKIKTEEEIIAELNYTRARAESAEGRAEAAAIAEEKARRAAKKAELNAKWGGTLK
mmetsp:Transcript_15006/g.15739  ORF Transcript_15006/g.15739 Transcript_15006/m.15739 type:complete len:261 (+) Transcript_15006:43-825(+)